MVKSGRGKGLFFCAARFLANMASDDFGVKTRFVFHPKKWVLIKHGHIGPSPIFQLKLKSLLCGKKHRIDKPSKVAATKDNQTRMAKFKK